MMGGIMDAIALALTSSLHIEDGRFLEGSWDNYFYTRQWNTPPDVEVHRHARAPGPARRRRRARRWPRPSPRSRAPTPGPPGRCRPASRSTTTTRSASTPQADGPADPAVADRRSRPHLLREPPCPRTPSSSTASSVTRRRRRRRPAAVGAPRPPRRHRPEVRLRHQRLQGLHPPHQRQGVQPLLGAGSRTSSRPTRSPRSRACRRPSARTCTRCSRPGSTTTSPSAATASPARSWPPSPWSTGPRAEGREITEADLDEHPQHLPVRHLRPDPRGRQGRRREHVRRRA